MELTQALNKIIANQNLSEQEMQSVMTTIMTGEATPAQIGGFLVALRMKGESIEEITGAAKVMRELSTKVKVNADNLVDTCGTGGDSKNTFNISTCTAFVAAAAGCHVAKHGNRSVSSSCGSADVLEAAGVNLNLNPQQVARAIQEVGVGFMFAPAHHSAMKHAIGPRKELAIRTIFNVLGPLTNPAGAPNQVLGVFDKNLLAPLAQVLKNLGSSHVLLAAAEDGLDEISIASDTYIAELKDGEITEYKIKPEDFGLERASLDSLLVDSAEQSLTIINNILAGQQSAANDIVVLNSAAAIYAANIVASLEDGVELAKDVISSGQAKEKLKELIEFSQNC
jgi:anthranilate phosphoribosyltransferase